MEDRVLYGKPVAARDVCMFVQAYGEFECEEGEEKDACRKQMNVILGQHKRHPSAGWSEFVVVGNVAKRSQEEVEIFVE